MVTVMYDSKQIHIAKTTNWHLHTDLNAKAGQEMVTRVAEPPKTTGPGCTDLCC